MVEILISYSYTFPQNFIYPIFEILNILLRSFVSCLFSCLSIRFLDFLKRETRAKTRRTVIFFAFIRIVHSLNDVIRLFSKHGTRGCFIGTDIDFVSFFFNLLLLCQITFKLLKY